MVKKFGNYVNGSLFLVMVSGLGLVDVSKVVCMGLGRNSYVFYKLKIYVRKINVCGV